MSGHRLSERTWKGRELQAASISSGVCPGCGLITIDLHAQDGARFAFGHFSTVNARLFLADLLELIGDVEREKSQPKGH